MTNKTEIGKVKIGDARNYENEDIRNLYEILREMQRALERDLTNISKNGG